MERLVPMSVWVRGRRPPQSPPEKGGRDGTSGNMKMVRSVCGPPYGASSVAEAISHRTRGSSDGVRPDGSRFAIAHRTEVSVTNPKSDGVPGARCQESFCRARILESIGLRHYLGPHASPMTFELGCWRR